MLNNDFTASVASNQAVHMPTSDTVKDIALHTVGQVAMVMHLIHIRY